MNNYMIKGMFLEKYSLFEAPLFKVAWSHFAFSINGSEPLLAK